MTGCPDRAWVEAMFANLQAQLDALTDRLDAVACVCRPLHVPREEEGRDD